MGFGPYYIKQQLFLKGIDSDLIEILMRNNYTEKEERRIAQAVFKKYCKKLKTQDQKTRDRLMRYLAGRGFEQSIIYDLVNKNNLEDDYDT